MTIQGPFSGQVAFTQPDGGSGWIIFMEISADDGGVNIATSVQVSFAGQSAPPAVTGDAGSRAPARTTAVVTAATPATRGQPACANQEV